MQSRHQSPIQGVWVPLVTPFSGGAVDGGALRRLVRHYAAAGVDGLVVCGSTGEAAALDDAEQLAVLDAVLTEAGALPVMMGLAGNHQGHVLQRLAAFGTRPLAGILAPAPYYVRPGQEGAAAYFRCLADASRFPLVLYDIPYRTGATLDASTLLALAAHPNIAAIKDCGGSLEKTVALIADGNMNVLAGEDLQSLSLLCLGGAGMIAAAAHIRPDLFVAMHRAVRAQQLDQARALFHALVPVIQLAFAEPNPGPVKAQLDRQGLLSAELRQPMPRASAAVAARMEAAVAGLNRQYPQ
ncbi:Dihydrodipicolinate synthase [Achromobacter denitrificans]|uniref:4-hydroxy-tetrahydrodipicolinate synthase n=1 Tax=Achromobacter denitrificans TaxID=32002 RepID=A0A6N0JTH6_ACHDE|nr:MULTISPECIES: 4-hydroxy-tetrahydrodipicolinate synthase [Achromobacter]MDF3859414.1 4-hydroxy-tetrahydrodipicolinate synthase [Achromobacter denitrificans]MDX3877348.1 4-hydroxy-tetrahydrodipicolinate synthase [Achromobacter sp.]OLU01454.1 4-hydroxy-tetrahydrodipicolinate synthase [Achromobacter denitrificans]QCS63227.1 4-hydroxy-tetrahydrodipicolinate synthase [Achromobacter denitrificans]QKH44059.1 4-hydroxy-tetrahydrodipicolinate synthase [Achromobacter denitrificans]